MREARVSEPDDWDHDFTIEAPAPGLVDHTVTPESGSVQISYTTQAGVEKWWNGTAYTTTPTTLATTITATRSKRAYTHQPETRGRIVTFTGWITRNGYDSPKRAVQVLVQLDSAAKLKW